VVLEADRVAVVAGGGDLEQQRLASGAGRGLQLASTFRLLISTSTRRLRAGELVTMRLASSNTIRAWSRVVAAE
jgi:hypothetical protein